MIGVVSVLALLRNINQHWLKFVRFVRVRSICVARSDSFLSSFVPSNSRTPTPGYYWRYLCKTVLYLHVYGLSSFMHSVVLSMTFVLLFCDRRGEKSNLSVPGNLCITSSLVRVVPTFLMRVVFCCRKIAIPYRG